MEALVSARHYAMSFTQILPFNSYNSPEKSKKFKQHLTSICIYSVPDVALNVLHVSFLSSWQLYEIGAIIILALQMKNYGLEE